MLRYGWARRTSDEHGWIASLIASRLEKSSIRTLPQVYELGFLQWGESNDIVMLFPQVHPHGTTAQERAGCFDVYGQKGHDYDAKSGVQMHALRSMMTAVASV